MIAYVIGAIPAVLAFKACLPEHESARIASPDGRLEAVVVEGNGGATTASWHRVELVERGEGGGRVVARFHGARDLAVRWSSPASVVLEYTEAHEAELKKASVEIAGRRVVVALSSR